MGTQATHVHGAIEPYREVAPCSTGSGFCGRSLFRRFVPPPKGDLPYHLCHTVWKFSRLTSTPPLRDSREVVLFVSRSTNRSTGLSMIGPDCRTVNLVLY
jgi:hypothetical protein